MAPLNSGLSKVQREAGAAARFGAHGYGASLLAHQFTHYRQPQSCAVDSFRGEEWVENTVCIFRGDAGAGVTDLDCSGHGIDLQRSMAFHRGAGVGYEVG